MVFVGYHLRTCSLHHVDTVLIGYCDLSPCDKIAQNRVLWLFFKCPKYPFSTQELSPCDSYRPVTIFWPCPEVVIISDNYCIGKMCLKSPCTSTSASSAVLAVQGLLRQILNSFPFLYCQILQMTLLNISPCPLPCSIALPIPLKCIVSYQPLIKIQLIKPNPLRRARAECNTMDYKVSERWERRKIRRTANHESKAKKCVPLPSWVPSLPPHFVN